MSMLVGNNGIGRNGKEVYIYIYIFVFLGDGDTKVRLNLANKTNHESRGRTNQIKPAGKTY